MGTCLRVCIFGGVLIAVFSLFYALGANTVSPWSITGITVGVSMITIGVILLGIMRPSR